MDKAATARGTGKKKKSLAPHQVLLRPLVTEKGMHRATRNNQYAFEVNSLADKADVRQAVETLFEVTGGEGADAKSEGQAAPVSVYLRSHKNWKKAIITLDS